MVSNYETMKRKMRKVFLSYDQEALVRRFALCEEGNFLLFPFMGGRCRIDRVQGTVECSDTMEEIFHEADYNEAMTVYDLLCWSRPGAVPAGRYVNMESLSPIGRSPVESTSRFFEEEAVLFDHRAQQLQEALAAMGGILGGKGDAAAEISVFQELRVLFRFWNSDEDFPPEIQFLWDQNVLSYMHYETVWFANHAFVDRLRRLMDRLPIQDAGADRH